MNKQELVSRVMNQTGFAQRDITAILNVSIEEIKKAVVSGDDVGLSGFGVFEPQRRAPRTARNPRKGYAVPIPATTVPRFRPSAVFKADMDQAAWTRR